MLDALRICKGSFPRNLENELTFSLTSWRASLPEVLQLRSTQLGTRDDEIWPSILLATSYRLECILYRTLCKQQQRADSSPAEYTTMKQRLHAAMFELDTVIGRVTAYGMLPCVNLSLYVF
jgi:hypothetical protein